MQIYILYCITRQDMNTHWSWHRCIRHARIVSGIPQRGTRQHEPASRANICFLRFQAYAASQRVKVNYGGAMVPSNQIYI